MRSVALKGAAEKGEAVFLSGKNQIFALSVAAMLKPVKSWQRGKFLNVGLRDDFIMRATAFRLMASARNRKKMREKIIIKRQKRDLRAGCETKECSLAF